MSKKGQSLGRAMRRGKRGPDGRPIAKRPFNNSKRNRGRKKQAEIEFHYHGLMDRMKYIKNVAREMKQDEIKLTEDNWKETVREYDKNLTIDSYEKMLLFQLVNNDA